MYTTPIRVAPSLVVAISLALAACHPGSTKAVNTAPANEGTRGAEWLLDRLYFGRSIPGGGTVSDEAWDLFLRDEATPKLPKGFTVFRARGQWLSADGSIGREDSFVLECVHENTEPMGAAIEALSLAYKKRFHQESVLRVTHTARVSFE